METVMVGVFAEKRALRVLAAMGAEADTRAASGRYVRSRDRRTGVRLWATTQQRYGQDLVGVQFYGRGRLEGERLAELMQRNAFIQRTPQAGQLTFAKPVPYADDGGVDAVSIARVRAEIDRLIGTADAAAPPASSGFRAFMLASPMAEVDLPEIDRPLGWRTVA